METNTKKSSKRKIFRIILILFIISIAVYVVKKYTYSLTHEGTDDAQLESNINPVLTRIGGFVTAVNFEDNQKVKKGDILIQLDDNDLKIKVAQAEAAVENAEANVNVIKANISSAEANVSTAKANIENAKIKVWRSKEDFGRYERLIAQKAITQQQFESAKAENESAEAQLEVAKKQMESAERQSDAAIEQVKVAESMVSQRRADLDFAKLQLSYANITAPADGIVSRKNVQVGQFVQAGQSLFSVVTDSDVWVIANFKETQLKDMKVGQPVEVEIDAFKGTMINGTIASFSAATGAKFSLLPPDNATGNFVKVVQRVPVKIKLAADSEMASKLRPGMSVKVEVNTEQKS